MRGIGKQDLGDAGKLCRGLRSTLRVMTCHEDVQVAAKTGGGANSVGPRRLERCVVVLCDEEDEELSARRRTPLSVLSIPRPS